MRGGRGSPSSPLLAVPGGPLLELLPALSIRETLKNRAASAGDLKVDLALQLLVPCLLADANRVNDIRIAVQCWEDAFPKLSIPSPTA